MSKTDVTGPLTQFQIVEITDKDDVRKLVASLKDWCVKSLEQTVVDHAFDREWPDLSDKLAAIPVDPGSRPIQRSPEDILAEVLETVRQIQRGMRRLTVLSHAAAPEQQSPSNQ